MEKDIFNSKSDSKNSVYWKLVEETREEIKAMSQKRKDQRLDMRGVPLSKLENMEEVKEEVKNKKDLRKMTEALADKMSV